MTRKIQLHIVLDLVIGWGLIAVGIYFGVTASILYIVYEIPLIIWYGIRAFMWLRILFDVFISKTETILTKGYRYSYRERVYPLIPKSRPRYSVILFDDVRLKGKYIYLDEALFSGGVELEVIYYPRSKYIKEIKRA